MEDGPQNIMFSVTKTKYIQKVSLLSEARLKPQMII